MAIQYGNTAISAIKYCNSSGTLVNVQSVQRNGATLWEKQNTATFYLEGVPANTTLLGTTGKVVSTSEPVRVNWGDGNTDTIAYSSNMRIPAHTYAAAGDYTIVISGTTLTGVSAVSSSDYPILAETNGTGLSYLKRAVFDGITSLGIQCFHDCSSLTSVTIPDSVTSIGIQCFHDCSSLTSVTIPDSVTSIGYNCFSGCSGLTSVTISSSVTSLGYNCFGGCTNLTSVTIPNSVTSLGEVCFTGCSGLTSVTIPNSVTSIGDDCFVGCSGLTSVSVESGNTVYDSRNGCNAIIETATNKMIVGCNTTVIPNTVTSLGNYCFYYCTNLTSVTIPSGVTSLGQYCFAHCSGLTSVTIPNSVTSIGDGCFESCSGLTSVTISSSVTSLGYICFSLCSGLTSVTIPNSVTSIGSFCFEYCSGLTSLTCEAETPPTLGYPPFDGVPKSIPVYVPSASVSTYQVTSGWSDFTNIQAISE